MQAIVITLFSIFVAWSLWHIKDWVIENYKNLKRYVQEDEQFNKEIRGKKDE